MKKWLSVLVVAATAAMAVAGVSNASKAPSTDAQVMLDADNKPVPADLAAKLVTINNNAACAKQQIQFINDAMKGGRKKASLSACDNADAELATGNGSVKANPSDIGTNASTITLYSTPLTEFRVLGILHWRAKTGQRFTFENNNGKREIQWFASKPTLQCGAVFGWTCTVDTEHASTVWETRPLTITANGNYKFKNKGGEVAFAHTGTLTWNGEGTWDDGNPLE